MPSHLQLPRDAFDLQKVQKEIYPSYLQKEKYDTQGIAQWQEAVEQIHGYAAGPKVRQLCQGTQLHCIVMQFCGWELVRMEEV